MEPGTQTIEMHQLDLRYAHTRIYQRAAVDRLHRSIRAYGQLSPVVAVPCREEAGRVILIDGYLRHRALHMCGKDTVIVRLSGADERGTLLSVIRGNAAKRWEALEEASLLNELNSRFTMSFGEIARETGRDKSWVKRRIDLVRSLPESVFEALQEGILSSWSATRVLAPLARANGKHAEQLLAHLRNNPLSTRELTTFLDHYRNAHSQARSKMAKNPSLFIKAARAKQEKRAAAELAGGPEAKWQKDLRTVSHLLLRLKGQVGAVAYPGQEALLRKELTGLLSECRVLIDAIAKEITSHDRPPDPGCDHRTPSEGNDHKGDLHTSGGIEEHGPVGGPGDLVAQEQETIRLPGAPVPRGGVIQAL